MKCKRYWPPFRLVCGSMAGWTEISSSEYSDDEQEFFIVTTMETTTHDDTDTDTNTDAETGTARDNSWFGDDLLWPTSFVF